VDKAKNNGYAIIHIAVLAYMAIPPANNIGIFRSFILVLEACPSNT
jgi:hypothetical protein